MGVVFRQKSGATPGSTDSILKVAFDPIQIGLNPWLNFIKVTLSVINLKTGMIF